MFDTKLKNFITWTLDFEIIDTKNPGRSVRNELNDDQLILVDPVEEIRPRTDPLWQCAI